MTVLFTLGCPLLFKLLLRTRLEELDLMLFSEGPDLGLAFDFLDGPRDIPAKEREREITSCSNPSAAGLCHNKSVLKKSPGWG